MRLLAMPILAGALAFPAAAQAPLAAQAGFRQGLDACRAVVEAKGASSPVRSAKAGAGLVDAPPDPPGLHSYFFKDAAKVEWWRRPTVQGRVHVGYDPARNACRVFLLAAPRGRVIEDAFAGLPAEWFAQEAGKTFVKRQADGNLLVMTLLPGDESKGIGPNTLAVMGLVWIVPAEDDEE